MISRFALFLSVVFLLAIASSAFAQSSATNTSQVENQASPLQITLDLEGQPAPGVLDYLTPFRVVITNVSNEPIRIGNPLAPEHRSSLRLELKPVGGEPVVIKRRDRQEEQQSRPVPFDGEPANKIITLTPGFPHYLEVNLSDTSQAEDGDTRRLEWMNLPHPCAPGDFSLSMTFESPATKETESSQMWMGSVTSTEQKVRLFAHRLLSPHRLLQHQFPDAALELLKENPKKWITRREEEEQWMPLHLAVMNGHLEVVKWLVEHDAPVHATDAEQKTPLHWASQPEILKVLLTASDSLDNRDGAELLQFAASQFAHSETDEIKERRREIAKLLREAGARNSLEAAIYLNEADSVLRELIADAQKNHPENLVTAFRLASRYGRTEICQTLLELPEINLFDPGEQDEDPLVLEALKQPALLKRFISQSERAKREFESHSSEWIFYGNATLLHYAAQRGTPETITLLIDHGFDIFAATGRESFDAELRPDIDAAVDDLLEIAIDDAINEENDEPCTQTPLEIAARSGKGDNVLAIIEHPKFKAAPRLVRWEALNQSLVALAGAASEPDANVRKWFTELDAAGADVRRLGLAAVQNAADQIHSHDTEEYQTLREAIAVLRELGADIDLPSAIAIGDEKLVADLLRKSPEAANVVCRNGLPALHRAVALSNPKIVTLLIESGCDIEIQSQTRNHGELGETALAVAARCDQFEIAKLLIDCGANVNAVDATGLTPLFAAFRAGDLKVAELLLENGARTDIQGEDGCTVHDWAEGSKEKEDLLHKFDPSKDRDPD